DYFSRTLLSPPFPALTQRFLFHRRRSRASGRPSRSIPKLADVNLQFVNRPAERVAVHSQFAGRAALVALVLLKAGEDKPLLEFADALGVKNIALVHLQNECFQLIFHLISLSRPMSL